MMMFSNNNMLLSLLLVIMMIHHYPIPSHADDSVVDFCIPDYKAPNNPAGYSCKNPAKVSSNDFVYTEFRSPSNTSNIFRVGLTSADDTTFGAVNGMGISGARVDTEPGASVPLHSHPRATEFHYLMKGKLMGAFISTNNTVYSTNLNPGDVFLIPQGLLHFFENIGKGPSVSIVSFSSSDPGLQITDLALFKSNLSNIDINKTTFIALAEARRLKALFGGRSG